MIEKRPRRLCSLHRRDRFGISIKEERSAKTFLVLAKVLGLFLVDAKDDDEYDFLLGLQQICINKIVQLKYVVLPFIHMPIQRLDRTINSFHDNQISEMFRFRTKADLRVVLTLLQIPLFVTTSNGSKFTGEELFLLFLRRMGTTGKMSLLVSEFGRDYSQWARGFRWMVLFIYTTWNHKLSKLHGITSFGPI
jgi:fumarate reductase subunit D